MSSNQYQCCSNSIIDSINSRSHFIIKVFCEQTRELTDDLQDFLDYV